MTEILPVGSRSQHSWWHSKLRSLTDDMIGTGFFAKDRPAPLTLGSLSLTSGGMWASLAPGARHDHR